MYFTADTHFGHRFITRHRGFGDSPQAIHEMDEALIERWNSKVERNADVFHLGDLSFRKEGETCGILGRLNGRIHLVCGNHDHKRISEMVKLYLVWAKDYYEISSRRSPNGIVLSHYAFRVWNRHHYGAWNLHGHSHGNLEDSGRRQMDVGVDTNDLTPYHIDEIQDLIGKRPIFTVDHHTPRK